MLFGYPNNSTEVRNLDYLLQQVQSLDNRVNNIVEGEIKEELDRFFDSMVISAFYDDSNERLVLDVDSAVIIADGHEYDPATEEMIIDGGGE